jgi:hypothetical protein
MIEAYSWTSIGLITISVLVQNDPFANRTKVGFVIGPGPITRPLVFTNTVHYEDGYDLCKKKLYSELTFDDCFGQFLSSNVVVGNVGLVMLLMMELHDFGRDDGLKS